MEFCLEKKRTLKKVLKSLVIKVKRKTILKRKNKG
ncbi:hypothetical protein N402_08395 [Helicobacter pylori FD423]|nr:hypothetical protein N402_08395 [Helicobacter pylori FD423]